MVALVALLVCASAPESLAAVASKKRRPPAVGRFAVVVDERLAVLREAPDLYARPLRRLSRGREVAVTGLRAARGGVTFYRVAVTRRTGGWLQRESVVSPAGAGDDERLLRLIRASDNFARVARARIFLDTFARSPLRPSVLLLYGEAAEEAAGILTRDAGRRLDEREMAAGGASVESYFLNFSGLDRYRRSGVAFVFDPSRKQYRYDGAAWREILRRHPRSPEAAEAQRRLALARQALVHESRIDAEFAVSCGARHRRRES